MWPNVGAGIRKTPRAKFKGSVSGLRLGLEAIAEAGVGVDEAPVGHDALELAAELAHVHVDRPVSRSQLATPNRFVELLARDDHTRSHHERHEQLVLAHRQREGPPAGQHEPVVQPDLELAGVQDVREFGESDHRAQARSQPPLDGCKLVIGS